MRILQLSIPLAAVGAANAFYTTQSSFERISALRANSNLPEGVSLPEVSLPEVSLPDLSQFVPETLPPLPDLPDATFMKLDSLSNAIDMSNPDTQLVAAGLGLLAIGSAMASSNTDSTAAPPSSKTGDVSIPYDAAARLAYQHWCSDREETPNEDGFTTFSQVYQQQSIAMVTAKKLARDMERLPNQKQVAPPPKKQPKKKPVPPVTKPTKRAAMEKPFFAS